MAGEAEWDDGGGDGSEADEHRSRSPPGDRRHDDHPVLPPPEGNLPRRAPLESVPRASVARLCEALVGIELGEVSLAGRGGTGWRVHGGRRRGL